MNQAGDENQIPVLLKEIVKVLKPKKGEKYIDATLGFGGHSLALLKAGSEVLAIEIDPKVLNLAKKRFQELCPNASWRLIEGNFAQIGEIARKNKFFPVDGIIFDLGISSGPSFDNLGKNLTHTLRNFGPNHYFFDLRFIFPNRYPCRIFNFSNHVRFNEITPIRDHG